MKALGAFFLLVLRLAIAGLFLFAAWQKLIDPQKFAGSINTFKILPEHLVQLATAAIPWIEVLCGLLLMAGLWTRAAATLLAALLIVFTCAIASVLHRNMSVSCGCFGRFSLICPHDKLSQCKIFENAIILIPTLLVAVFGGGLFALDQKAGKTAAGTGPENPTPPSPSRA
ncbi:MAG: DoxX family protein [Phycisphaerales bacterium]|nr:DoxX family protein [Planctomycetota bacterium]